MAHTGFFLGFSSSSLSFVFFARFLGSVAAAVSSAFYTITIKNSTF